MTLEHSSPSHSLLGLLQIDDDLFGFLLGGVFGYVPDRLLGINNSDCGVGEIGGITFDADGEGIGFDDDVEGGGEFEVGG